MILKFHLACYLLRSGSNLYLGNQHDNKLPRDWLVYPGCAVVSYFGMHSTLLIASLSEKMLLTYFQNLVDWSPWNCEIVFYLNCNNVCENNRDGDRQKGSLERFLYPACHFRFLNRLSHVKLKT